MDAKKDARGGSRPGAGRKPKGESNKVQVAYWLDPKIVEIIRAQPNQAEFIEAAVRDYHGKTK